MGKLLAAFTEYYNSHTKEQRKADMDELEPYNHVGILADNLINNIKK